MESPLEPRIILAILTAALVIGAAVLLFMGRRWKRHSFGTKQLESILSSLQGLDPSLVRILKSLLDTGAVEELAKQDDVQKALKKLQLKSDRQKKKETEPMSSSVLAVRMGKDVTKISDIDPAFITILRAAYLSRETSERLPSETLQELDNLLDTLTA